MVVIRSGLKSSAPEDAGCRHVISEPYWIEDERKSEAIRLVGKIKAALG